MFIGCSVGVRVGVMVAVVVGLGVMDGGNGVGVGGGVSVKRAVLVFCKAQPASKIMKSNPTGRILRSSRVYGSKTGR